MDSGLITAITALLTAIGAGVGFFIRRADKRRETNEALVIAHLTAQLTVAERAGRHKDRVIKALRKDVSTYREQLISHGIDPIPAELTEVPEEDG